MAQTDTQRDRQYLNMLVFAAAAGILSLLIMAVTLAAGGTDAVKRLTPAIVTVEIGLLLVVSYVVYRSVRHLARLGDESKAYRDARLHVTKCPDYWTLDTASGTCTNTFVDPLNPRTRYVVFGTDAPPDAPGGDLDAGVRSLALSDFEDLKVRELCPRVHEEVRAPWSAVDGMCS